MEKELNDHNYCIRAWEAEGKEDQHPGLIHDKYDTVLSCAKSDQTCKQCLMIRKMAKHFNQPPQYLFKCKCLLTKPFRKVSQFQNNFCTRHLYCSTLSILS